MVKYFVTRKSAIEYVRSCRDMTYLRRALSRDSQLLQRSMIIAVLPRQRSIGVGL